MKSITLKHINTALLIAIVSINGYIIFTPVVPNILFSLNTKNAQTIKSLERKITALPPTDTTNTSNQQNQLIIPSMLLDAPIHTGSDARTLRQGLWLRPQGSTPDRGGNTVIAAHRFTYTNPKGTFYHLDKVRVGDAMQLTWNNKAHRYIVSEVKVVKATETAIESPSAKPRLTLYTCTPLWLPNDRLVVIAEEQAI